MWQIISSDLFNYDSKNRTLSQDMSVLRFRSSKGFNVKSSRTGRIVSFGLQETVKDSEGEVTHWVFRPGIVAAQECGIDKVMVWND